MDPADRAAVAAGPVPEKRSRNFPPVIEFRQFRRGGNALLWVRVERHFRYTI
jgi:hypothetical protein